jgi:AcrR family transcriptional regulator
MERSSRQWEILDELEAIYLAEGFRRLGVGALAARLRCSRRTLYELAPSKSALFLLVLDRFLHRIREKGAQRAAAEPDPRARVAALLEPGITETRRAGDAFAADVAAFEPARRLLDRHQRARMAELRDVLESGVASGAFRGVHAEFVADLMLAAVGRARDPALLRRTRLSMSEAFEECSRLLQHGLLHPQAARRRSATAR